MISIWFIWPYERMKCHVCRGSPCIQIQGGVSWQVGDLSPDRGRDKSIPHQNTPPLGFVCVSVFYRNFTGKKDFNRIKISNETQNQFSKLWSHKYWRKIYFFIFHGIWRVPGWYAYWKASKCHKWKTTQLYILRGYFKF